MNTIMRIGPILLLVVATACGGSAGSVQIITDAGGHAPAEAGQPVPGDASGGDDAAGSDSAGPTADDGSAPPLKDAGSLGPCTTDVDCGTGERCGYLQSLGCAAHGECVVFKVSACGAIGEACACDGTSVEIGRTGYPSGYVGKAYSHAGSCN